MTDPTTTSGTDLRSDEHLYVIQDRMTGHLKVGKSSDPQRRIRRLQTGCPGKLVIVSGVVGGGFLEPVIHQAFSAYSVRGEWYKEDSPVSRLVRDDDEQFVSVREAFARLSDAFFRLSADATAGPARSASGALQTTAVRYERRAAKYSHIARSLRQRAENALYADTDISGIPVRGISVRDGGRIVSPVQREFWDENDYAVNAAEIVVSLPDKSEVAQKLAYECEMRYGQPCPVPDPIEVDGEPIAFPLRSWIPGSKEGDRLPYRTATRTDHVAHRQRQIMARDLDDVDFEGHQKRRDILWRAGMDADPYLTTVGAIREIRPGIALAAD